MLFVNPAFAQTTADAFIEFSGGTSGAIVTSTALNSMHHGDGVWKTEVSLSTASLTFGAFTNFTSPALPGPVKVGGVIYNGTTTKCISMRHDQFEAAVLTPSAGNHSKVLVGYWWNPGFNGGSDFGFYDEVSIMAGSDFSVNSWEMNGNTDQKVKAHTQTGTSAGFINLKLAGVDTVNTTWFWVSQLFEAGQLAKIAIYDTNLNQIQSTVSLAIGAGQTVADIHFGNHHNPGNLHPANSLYNNIVFQFDANAVFPLLPTNQPDCLIADHRTDWTTAGVRGGVPTVSTIYTNFYSTNTDAQINTGIANCPSNQVVKLNGGPYNLTNFLDISKSGVVVRGDGPTNTQIFYWGGGFQAARIRGSGTINPPPNNVTWTNGYTAGSTNLFFSSVPNLTVGQVVTLTENPDPNVVSPSGSDVPADYSGMLANSTLIHQQIVVVTAITTNMVTVFPPIYATNWLSSLSPQAFWLGSNTSVKKSGYENLCIDTSNGTPSYNILVQDTVDCWLKNVESRSGNLAHVYWFSSCCGDIRECYFHIDTSYGTSSYGTYLYCSSAIKVEDNIFYEVTGPVRFATASGNVIGYNYIAWARYDTSPHFMNEGIKTHGGHPDYNLYEGNEFTTSTNGVGIYFDNTHGSSSHNTAFRNDAPGWDTNMTDNTFAIGVMCSNRWENIICNVLGVKGYHTNYATPPSVAPNCVFMLGYSNTAWTLTGYDIQVTNTILIHGNYDTVTSTNGGIVYTAGLSTSFSNSYYYASTPVWWDNSRWPGVGGDLSSTNFTPNPAMTRFAGFQGGVGSGPPVTSALGPGTTIKLGGGVTKSL